MNVATIHRRKARKEYRNWMKLIEVRTKALKSGITEDRLKEIASGLDPENEFARKYRRALEHEIKNPKEPENNEMNNDEMNNDDTETGENVSVQLDLFDGDTEPLNPTPAENDSPVSDDEEPYPCPECGGEGQIYWTGTTADPDDPSLPIAVEMRDVCPMCRGERFL